MGEYFHINPQQTFSILNWLVESKKMNFFLDTPWVGQKLFDVEMSKDSTQVQIKTRFGKSTFQNKTREEGLSINSMAAMLASSGFKKPTEWNGQFAKIIDEASRDFYKGERPCMVVFDTNALISRFYTLMERERNKLAGRNLTRGWGYLITTGIIGELSKYEHKYKDYDIKKLSKKSVKWLDWSDFRNQLSEKDRLFRMGSVEAYKMRTSGRCIRVESDVGDANIIDAIIAYRNSQNVDIIAASRDGDFVSMCCNREIPAILFDTPRLDPNRKHMISSGWTELADFLYCLAVRLGVIRLAWTNKEYVLFQGIWPGKHHDDWIQELVRVSSTNLQFDKAISRLLGLGYGL